MHRLGALEIERRGDALSRKFRRLRDAADHAAHDSRAQQVFAAFGRAWCDGDGERLLRAAEAEEAKAKAAAA